MHGDDYVSIGSPEALKWMQAKLENKYQVKTQLLRPGKEHSQQLEVLNRIIPWHDHRGITYEADPRHAELVIEQLGPKDASIVSTPSTREEGHTKEDSRELVNEKQATKYRAVIALCNFMGPDRPDIAYAVKDLARAMSKPTDGDVQRSKRLGRHLKGKPRFQQWYKWQLAQRVMKTYSDAEWAGCKGIRMSTSGGCAMIGAHDVKAWSRTQFSYCAQFGRARAVRMFKGSG